MARSISNYKSRRDSNSLIALIRLRSIQKLSNLKKWMDGWMDGIVDYPEHNAMFDIE